MVQILYSIAAIMLLGITVLNINVKIHGTEERMMLSELSLEMTSIGAEILNEAARMEYDQGATFGLVLDVDSLETTTAWGTGSCDPDASFSGCFTINNLQGKTATRSLSRVYEGTTYDVTYDVSPIQVCYAAVAPPHACAGESGGPPAGARTYAKKVSFNVSTPVLVDANGDPYEIPMSRVYMYPSF